MSQKSGIFSIYGDILRSESELSYHVLCAKNELMGMEIQLKGYLLKNGENEQYKKSKERLEIIWEAIKKASSIESECYERRVVNDVYLAEIARLKKENEQFRNQIIAHEKAWNQE